MKKLVEFRDTFKNRNAKANALLNENSRKSKAKKLFSNPESYRNGKHIIETFAILTANNPNTQSFDRSSNNKLNKQLKDLMSYENPESILSRYKFNYYKVKGKYGNKEDSFLIYNLSLEDAKSLATRFQQQSFIFGKNTDDGLVFQFWANKSKSGYVFAKADEKAIFDDVTDKEDYYTQISKDFKFSIPFEKFGFDDDEMMESLYSKWFSSEKYRKYFDENLTNSLDSKYTFLGRTMFREKLFSNNLSTLNESAKDVRSLNESNARKAYEVEFRDDRNGATSSIDTVFADGNYTAEDYIEDCMLNADDEWNEMLSHGEVVLHEIDLQESLFEDTKDVSIDKMSKKDRKAFYDKQRNVWGRSPVTKTKPSDKIYDRKKMKNSKDLNEIFDSEEYTSNLKNNYRGVYLNNLRKEWGDDYDEYAHDMDAGDSHEDERIMYTIDFYSNGNIRAGHVSAIDLEELIQFVKGNKKLVDNHNMPRIADDIEQIAEGFVNPDKSLNYMSPVLNRYTLEEFKDKFIRGMGESLHEEDEINKDKNYHVLHWVTGEDRARDYGNLPGSDVKRMMRGYKYDDELGMWFSKTGNSGYSITEIKESLNEEDEVNRETNDNSNKCPNCGRNLITDSTGKHCPVCDKKNNSSEFNTSSISKGAVSEEYEDDDTFDKADFEPHNKDEFEFEHDDDIKGIKEIKL